MCIDRFDLIFITLQNVLFRDLIKRLKRKGRARLQYSQSVHGGIVAFIIYGIILYYPFQDVAVPFWAQITFCGGP